jgi:hypothetical protein
MYALVTFVLIELCGSNSFQVRQCASACLHILDNVPVRGVDEAGLYVQLSHSSLDEGCLSWGKNHRDPEIRARVARLR